MREPIARPRYCVERPTDRPTTWSSTYVETLRPPRRWSLGVHGHDVDDRGSATTSIRPVSLRVRSQLARQIERMSNRWREGGREGRWRTEMSRNDTRSDVASVHCTATVCRVKASLNCYATGTRHNITRQREPPHRSPQEQLIGDLTAPDV